MQVTPIKTSLFRANENLLEFIISHLPALEEQSVLVVTSKIVALSQGRVANLADKEKVIADESIETIPTEFGTLTLTAAGWCINAGVDESNSQGQLILLPKQPLVAAEELRVKLIEHFNIQNLGIIITDTRTVPLRKATIGRAIAIAGFNPLKSYIGAPDLYGRKSRMTQSNIADALAASAVLTMGEGDEQTPLAVVSDAPIEFTLQTQADESFLSMSPEDDIYKPLFTRK
ncbi:MAG TPA: coenzyme F420-0:L-glutamate ligase [Patescibacteria group bacterium]|jgi:F420-0:gamma-glutamyl ligase|nr:coenzyme F420-0:L-glutamate ligase [Patescibacteria group bacterium]